MILDKNSIFLMFLSFLEDGFETWISIGFTIISSTW